MPFWSDVVLGFRPMSAAELQKFPQHRWGQAFTTLKCDCPPYLLWLEKRSVCCRMGVGRKAQARGSLLGLGKIGEGLCPLLHTHALSRFIAHRVGNLC